MPEASLTLVESAKAPRRFIGGDEGPLPPWHSINIIDGTAYFDFVKINLAVFRRLCQLCFGLTIQRNIFQTQE